MEPTEIILSFVISYIAGIIPTEWFSNHKSMKEKLELCFKSAVNKWTNNPDTQNAVGEQMDKYLPQLKDFIPLAVIQEKMICLDYGRKRF